MSGNKYDGGKPRFDLVPPEPLEELAKLYGLGAKKYGDRNWEEGFEWGRLFSALMRHAWAWWRGEKLDPVDGQHHLIAVIWNAIGLYEHERRQLGRDDRYKTGSHNIRSDQPPQIDWSKVTIGGKGVDIDEKEL